MAQLIKLHDFISRYETDIYRYPSQYIRLKKDRWEKIRDAFEDDDYVIEKKWFFQKASNHFEPFEGFEDFNEDWLENEKKGIFGKIKGLFNKPKKDAEAIDIISTFNESTDFFVDRTKSIEEIKQDFLDELFHFQINWASSTIRDRSVVHQSIYNDEILKYFLQHFPDNYLLLYKPTLIVKRAPIDLELVLISPIITYCISLIERDEMSVFTTDRGRYWYERSDDVERKTINPMLALNRTESLIQSYYKHYEVDMPVQKIVLSRNGFIEGDYEPTNTLIVDKRNYSEWYSRLRRLPSPIKFNQLKGAQVLLKHSQSTYVRRYEWETSEDNSYLDDEWE